MVRGSIYYFYFSTSAMKLTECFRISSRKIVQFFKDVSLGSGIHGLKHTFNGSLHPFERIFWFMMVVMALLGAGYISWFQFQRYEGNPTVMSLERDYRAWSSILPAVTLCYKNRVDKTLANEFLLRKWNITVTDDDYTYFFDFVSAVINTTVESYEKLAQYSTDERIAEFDLVEVLQIGRTFEQEVSIFDSHIPIDVQVLMTERGLCYSINSLIPDIFNNSQAKEFSHRKPATCLNRRRQCFIKIYVPDNDVVAIIHTPYEAYSIEMEAIDMEMLNEIKVYYRVVETVASNSLRDLSPSQRKCVFPDEDYDDMPIFSKSICLMKCRIDMALSLCDCVPLFYSFSEGPFCTATGMACLQDFSWPSVTFNPCKCPRKCVSSEYTMNRIDRKTETPDYDHTQEKKFIFKLEVIPPTTRIRRNVLFSFEDFLVSFGGGIALFLGFSIWSISRVSYVIMKYAMSYIIYLSSKKPTPIKLKPTTKRN